MDANQTYCGDHFTIYPNIKSLCCTPETNILHVNYISVKNKKHDAKKNDNYKRRYGLNLSIRVETENVTYPLLTSLDLTYKNLANGNT